MTYPLSHPPSGGGSPHNHKLPWSDHWSEVAVRVGPSPAVIRFPNSLMRPSGQARGSYDMRRDNKSTCAWKECLESPENPNKELRFTHWLWDILRWFDSRFACAIGLHFVIVILKLSRGTAEMRTLWIISERWRKRVDWLACWNAATLLLG